METITQFFTLLESLTWGWALIPIRVVFGVFISLAIIEAVRDFWLARVELTRLVGTRLPSTPDTLDAGPSASDILQPAGSAPMTQHDHAGQP